jgi:uncharacterized damage-inducible protein DinB
MTISEMVLPEFDQEMANTRKILERVPDDKLNYKPHEKSMTLGRLAGHIAELPSWGSHTLQLEVLELQTGQQPFSAKSTRELLDKFDEGTKEARSLISAASDEELKKTWTMNFAGKTVLSMPRSMVLRNVVMNHLIHHRAQLGVYLRLLDVEIPGMYGPSADEMKFWSDPKAGGAS